MEAGLARQAAMMQSGQTQAWMTQLTAIKKLANVLASGGMDRASFDIPKGQVLSHLVARPVCPTRVLPELLARIDALHASGALTDADVAALRSRFATS
jgi:hypothetical protein